MSEKDNTSPLDDLIKKAGERGFTLVLGKDLRINIGKDSDVSVDIGKKRSPGLHIAFNKGKDPEVSLYGVSKVPERENPYRNERMKNVEILKDRMSHTDDEIFSALCFFGGKKLSESPVAALEKGRKLFASVWRYMCESYRYGSTDFFTLIFGKPRKYSWYSWNSFDQARFDAFVHETERQLRAYLRAGRKLKEKESEGWVKPYAQAVIAADMKAEEEASRPVVNIDFGGLEKIREDAVVTRDWLLTEEETEDIFEESEDETEEETASLVLEGPDLELLLLLIDGEPADEYMRSKKILPSVAADRINEAFFEYVGDSIIECDGEELSLVEDYRKDVLDILRGNN